MGFFDIFNEALDAAVSLPGKILEAGAEAVVRSPEVIIKAGHGLVKGVEKGADKVGDAINDILD